MGNKYTVHSCLNPYFEALFSINLLKRREYKSQKCVKISQLVNWSNFLYLSLKAQIADMRPFCCMNPNFNRQK